jgi:hypothetical protein
MAKRAKRGRRKTRQVSLRPERDLGMGVIPSAQTLFRADLLDPQTDALMTRLSTQLGPKVRERDAARVKKIEQAATAEVVLDLVPIATGMAEHAWRKRVRQFGPEIVPLIVARLTRARDIQDRHVQSSTYEHLIGALRWQGKAGGAALLGCFDDLDDYGRSLACVVLGLLGAQASADTLWAFYEIAKHNVQESYFIGALWGLIDLQDPRATDALADLLWEERFLYELFGFLSLAGGARAVLPLLVLAVSGGGDVAQHAAMALLSIGHRIGRETLLAEFQQAGAQTADQQRHREGMVDDILATPPHNAEEYFALFYRGLRADDIDLDEMGSWLQAFDERWGDEIERRAREMSASPPTAPGKRDRLGRNDPCWCDSGKKYKHCHMRQDMKGRRG